MAESESKEPQKIGRREFLKKAAKVGAAGIAGSAIGTAIVTRIVENDSNEGDLPVGEPRKPGEPTPVATPTVTPHKPPSTSEKPKESTNN